MDTPTTRIRSLLCQVLLWAAAACLCGLAAALMTGCESSQERERSPGTAPASLAPSGLPPGVTSWVYLVTYTPSPMPAIPATAAYSKKLAQTLQHRAWALVNTVRPDTNHLGTVTAQFHLNTDGSITHLRLLTNSFPGDWGATLVDTVVTTSFDPWPEEVAQKRYAGYWGLRVLVGVGPQTNSASGWVHAAMNSEVSLEPADAAPLGPNYLARGLSNLQSNHFSAALAEFARELEFDPEDAWAYWGRGKCRCELKHYEQAAEDFSKALDLDPFNARAWCGHGRARLALHDLEGAVRDCTQALALNVEDAEAYVLRADAEASLQELSAAMDDVSKALQLAPSGALAYVVRAHIKFFQGDYAGALTDCNVAAALKPELAAAYRLRGLLQHVTAQPALALESFQTALQLDPSRDYVRLRLWLMRSQTQGMGPASAELAAHLKSVSSAQAGWWVYHLGAFLVGEVNEATLLSEAERSAQTPRQRTEQICEATYYAGMKRLLGGDEPGARSLLQKCLATGQKNFDEYHLARAELRRLNDSAPSPRQGGAAN